MWDYNLSSIIGLMRKTFPFLVFRFMIYATVTLISVAITGGGAGIGWLGGLLLGDAPAGTFYGGLAGAGGAFYFLYVVREYLLYQVKAGHIAILVKFMDGEPVPEGQGMVTYAKDQVKEHFVQSNVLFLADQLIKGVLKVISRLFSSVANAIPIPGLQFFITVVSKVVSMSLTYVDEIILAYHMKNSSGNVWGNSCKGLVLYTMNYHKMLKNAFWLSLLVWILMLFVFILVFGPVAAIVTVFPSLAGFWTFAVAGVLTWGIKSAVIDPIAMTALMQVYFKVIEGQVPNPEMEQKLESLSDNFKTMKDKSAAAGIGGNFKPFVATTLK